MNLYPDASNSILSPTAGKDDCAVVSSNQTHRRRRSAPWCRKELDAKCHSAAQLRPSLTAALLSDTELCTVGASV